MSIGRGLGDARSVAFGPDGRIVACGAGKDVLIYDLGAYDEDVEWWIREVRARQESGDVDGKEAASGNR